jgi:two-component sensor histidine kinase
MQVLAFRTVRARLLALMVLVVLPIAVIAAVTATMTYRSVLASIESSQIQTIGNFAVRTRVWYRETLRALLTAVATVPAAGEGASCDSLARRIVTSGAGYEFVAMQVGERPPCQAARSVEISPGTLATVQASFLQRPRTASWVGQDLAEARYGQVVIDGKRYLGVHARQEGTATAPAFEAILLIDAVILDRSFDLGTIMPGEIVIARGAREDDSSWLPRSEMLGRNVARWDDLSRNGARAIFASQVVAEPDLVVLARFDTSAERAAFLQFIALLLTPLVTLAVLFAAYSLAIDSNIIRWIRGIEAAAVASASRTPKPAPVDPAMPEDILRVSEAFNRLMAEQNDRLEKLNATVGANRYLVRELHHRVKNSLQVVQSYLGLARREHGEAHRGVLAEVEAKVQVLSIAYRHALAHGEMRPVELKPLLEEVSVMLGGLMRQGQPWVTTTAPDGVALVIDRAIPLGLLAVEVAGSVQRARPSAQLDVSLRQDGEAALILAIDTDAEVPGAADTRIAHGLLRQLEATPLHPAAGRSLGQWRVPI